MATDLGSGVLYEATTTGSGTGNYSSFVRIQDNGVENGYNTDANNQLDNKDGIWTHSLLIANMAVVNVGGTDYYEIRLDLDEVQSASGPNITLDDLQIFYGAAAGAGAFPTFAGLTKVFDLSGTLALVDTNHGSGTDDYRFLLPTSLFPDTTQYFTLYAQFSGADDGFEEFRVKTQEFVPQADIGINKQTNGTDDTCGTILTGETVTWTYTVTNNGNLPLSNIVVTDDNGTPGNTSDDFHPDAVLGADLIHNIGDVNNDGILGLTETWLYTASGTAQEGEYENIATVTGGWAFGGNNGTASAGEEDCYVGATPAIAINKLTNGTDDVCPTILAGESVTWTYNVTNAGDIDLSNVVVTDDNGTAGDTSDDFNPDAVLGVDLIHNIGDVDNDGILDLTETWQYIASGTAQAGEYTNVATVTGDATDDSQNKQTVDNSEEDCYFGATPAIAVVKETNGSDDLCPVVSVGESVTWTYDVTNAGDIALSNIVVTDDNGTPGDTSDDFNPDAFLGADLIHNIGDVNNNGFLDLTETWQYSATGTVLAGHYTNIATVTGDATDDFQNTTTVDANEDDCYVGVEGCVRTPGFWQNPRNGGQFWDGTVGNEKHAGEEHFPTGDLLYSVDSNNDGFLNGKVGLLIGDYNMNGLTDGGEDTLFISLSDARALINANNKLMSDGVVKIGRDVVATWLNYLSGAAIGDASDDGSPHHFIDDAIDYLQIFGDSNVAGNTNTNDVFDTYAAVHGKVNTSSAFWNNDFPGGDHSGSEIHSALDGYNNTGAINGIVYSASCDNPQFLEELKGFSLEGSVYLV